MLTLKKKEMTKRLSAAVLSLVIILYQFIGTAPFTLGLTAFAAEATTNIPLRRIDGSGKAFIYHSFNETTEFTEGETYAFLDGVYGAENAVSALGAGAILKILSKEPNGAKYGSEYYIQKKYGSSAKAKVYVAVKTPGKDFDFCPNGGLYQVPNTAKPTEYRYFCWKGGAYNCGPYYAYTYTEESVVSDNVTASLKNIENQGSQNPEDYTVTITYDGNKKKVLDNGSYKVKFTSPDKVTIIVSDSVGNSITANFQSPLAVRYDGNSENALNVPSVQTAWKNESSNISSAKPTLSGYSFINWKDSDTSKTYTAGQSFTPASSMRLLAQWKDILAPVIDYTPAQVMTGDSDETVKKAVLDAITVTDNEPVSECTITVTLPANFTKTAGNKNATVTVKDKAGNTATKECSVYVSSYVDISKPVFTASTKNLTATLNNPGTDTITESGFVWGVMNSPSLKVNNGNEKTATAVSNAGGKISVTASNLQKGVTYYARAYITAGGVTYYSEEITVGLGLPAYGTFTVKNNEDNTFTIIRSGGTEGKQTVYYRTVNGSAVGGTHFRHLYGSWTFNDGETSKNVPIDEFGTNEKYTENSTTYPATAYSNADRTYSLEIYKVDGGGSLGSTTSAVRTMKNNSRYKVDRSVYNETKGTTVTVADDKKYVVDRSGGSEGDLYWKNNRGYNKNYNQDNFNTSFNVSGIHKSSASYIKATAQTYLYRYTMNVTEEEDCYEQAWMGTHEPDNAHSDTKCGGDYTKKPVSLTDKNAGSAIWTAVFLAAQGYKNVTKNFPSTSIDKNEDKGSLSNKVYACNSSDDIVSEDGKTYAKIPIADTVYNFFSATGSGKDIWRVENFTDYIKICDSVEPQLIAVAPMEYRAIYKTGDTFVVSLIFDEIVDSKNSTNLSSVKVNTSWGTASYAGGADTNVLYFTGTVASNASGNLKVNSITNPSYIKDMCNSTTTKATASGSGTTDAKLDTSIPNFTVTANGITNGTGKATVTVNADKTKTTGMSYAWSDSATAPTSGWVELSSSELNSAKSTSGLSLSIRKDPGSGKSNGKWYLHVKGVYNTTGASGYKSAYLDFGTAASPASGSTSPTLTVTADNTNWAKSRKISISATGAQALKYRKSDAASWTTLSTTANSVTVNKNGYYTFLLTADDVTVTKTVSVERIDLESPTASIGEPTNNSKESPKSGVYTEIELPITYADAGSGVKTVQYKWTDSTATPSSWDTGTGKTAVTYTASESTAADKYLHIKVSDNVGYSYTTCSSPFKVISETAVKNHTPTITITGAPTKWTNDTATLTWQLSNYEGKNYEVILPDGKTSSETSGEVWARQNGDYTVTVRDLEYGGENTATVKVVYIDTLSPTVTVSGGNNGWTNTDQTLTITASDTQSGVGKKWYKIVENTKKIPTEGLTELTGNTITLSKEGRYYLYYKIYDNAGDTELDREANKTEGFKAVLIDKTAPAVSFGEYSANAGITVTATDITSKLASLSYRIGNGTEIPITLTNGQIEKVFTITDLPAGDSEITVTATDNAGLCTTLSKSVHVEIVSVEITWNALEFTYSDGTWNAKSHTYEGVSWKPNNTDSNKIAVKNSGETAVSVTYSYTPSNSAVSGSFTDGIAPITAPIALNVSEEKSTWLILNGKPDKTINNDLLGSVTVTIGGN